MEGDLFLEYNKEDLQLLEQIKISYKDDKYINTEIIRLRGFLNDPKNTLLCIIKADLKRVRLTNPEYIPKCPLVGVKISRIFEFLSYKHSAEDEEIFMLYLGIKCIMGKRKEAENLNHALVFARASGNISTQEELHPRIKKYNTRRMKDKYRRLLEQNYRITFFQSKNKRGFGVRLNQG